MKKTYLTIAGAMQKYPGTHRTMWNRAMESGKITKFNRSGKKMMDSDEVEKYMKSRPAALQKITPEVKSEANLQAENATLKEETKKLEAENKMLKESIIVIYEKEHLKQVDELQAKIAERNLKIMALSNELKLYKDGVLNQFKAQWVKPA